MHSTVALHIATRDTINSQVRSPKEEKVSAASGDSLGYNTALPSNTWAEQ